MKKISIAFLLLALLISAVSPALAKEQPASEPGTSGSMQDIFSLTGKITAIDSTAHTVTIKVWRGNQLVKPFIGDEVTLQTLAFTRFLLKDAECNVTPIAFDDLAVGQKVGARGRLVEGVWRAWRITVQTCTCPCP